MFYHISLFLCVLGKSIFNSHKRTSTHKPMRAHQWNRSKILLRRGCRRWCLRRGSGRREAGKMGSIVVHTTAGDIDAPPTGMRRDAPSQSDNDIVYVRVSKLANTFGYHTCTQTTNSVILQDTTASWQYVLVFFLAVFLSTVEKLYPVLNTEWFSKPIIWNIRTFYYKHTRP